MKLGTYLEIKSISHADFASMIETTQASVTRYVNGKRRPSIEMIDKISKVTRGKVRMHDWFKDVPEQEAAE